MELFKLFGKIAVDNENANKQIDDTTEKAEKSSSKIGTAFGKIGSGAVKIAKIGAVGITAVGSGITALTANAIKEYSEYEQLAGGVETLFKENNDKVVEYANNAYKTAGLSANEYMDTVTSFSASLLQSLDGDTSAAADKANMAITDMSDNANKMGTSMEMIQNAYQGFSKQNYTMLDNLKLGYGGTKEEMQRLLDKANEINAEQGIITDYQIDSYADIVDAIHVVQTEMDITGTTSKEASTTIQGSIGQMKSAWTNFMTGMSDPSQDFDTLVGNLVNSVVTTFENIAPKIISTLPRLVNGFTQLINKLLPYIPKILQPLFPAIVTGAVEIIQGLVSLFPQLIDILLQSIPDFINGLSVIFEEIVAALPALVTMICETLPEIIPALIDGAVNAIVVLASNISSIIQPIIDSLPKVIISIVDALMNNLPALIDGCIQLIFALTQAQPQILMALISSIPSVVMSIVEGLWNAFPILLNGVIDIVSNVGVELWNKLSNFATEIGDFFKKIWSGIKDVFKPSNVGEFFSDVWKSIKGAFGSVADWFHDIFSKAWKKVKDVFSTGGKVFDGIKEGIADTFKTVVNGLIKGINKIISIPFKSINKMLNKIHDVSVLGVEPFKKLWDKNPLPTPEIPQLEKGGILKRGQVGLLEGNGTEAVVPLEKNKAWTSKVAKDMNEISGNNETLIEILNVLKELRDILPDILIDALCNSVKLEINNREFARLVKGV